MLFLISIFSFLKIIKDNIFILIPESILNPLHKLCVLNICTNIQSFVIPVYIFSNVNKGFYLLKLVTGFGSLSR